MHSLPVLSRPEPPIEQLLEFKQVASVPKVNSVKVVSRIAIAVAEFVELGHEVRPQNFHQRIGPHRLAHRIE